MDFSQESRASVQRFRDDPPQPVLEPDALYLTDNGALYHGRCCGFTAQYTGRDISGQEVVRLGPAEHAEMVKMGIPDSRIVCESCGEGGTLPDGEYDLDGERVRIHSGRPEPVDDLPGCPDCGFIGCNGGCR